MLQSSIPLYFVLWANEKGRHTAPALFISADLAHSGRREYLEVGGGEVGIEGEDLGAAQVLYYRVVHAVGEGELGLLIGHEDLPGAAEDYAIGHEEAYQVGAVEKLVDCLSGLQRAEDFERGIDLLHHVVGAHEAYRLAAQLLPEVAGGFV